MSAHRHLPLIQIVVLEGHLFLPDDMGRAPEALESEIVSDTFARLPAPGGQRKHAEIGVSLAEVVIELW